MHYSEASGWLEQSTKPSKKAALEFTNTTLIIKPTAVTSTVMKLGIWINAKL